MSKSIIQNDNLNTLYTVLGAIMDFSKVLVINIQNSIDGDNIGEKLLMIIPFLKIYQDYFNNYQKVADVIRHEKNNNKKFLEWITKTEKMCQKDNRLGMMSYMIQPVQRIPRYNLLLKELLNQTNESHKDYQNIKKALEGTVSVADFLNTRMREMNNEHSKEKLIQQLIIKDEEDLLGVLKSHRTFLCKGQQEIVESSNRDLTPFDINDTYMFMLISDMLLVCEKCNVSKPAPPPPPTSCDDNQNSPGTPRPPIKLRENKKTGFIPNLETALTKRYSGGMRRVSLSSPFSPLTASKINFTQPNVETPPQPAKVDDHYIVIYCVYLYQGGSGVPWVRPLDKTHYQIICDQGSILFKNTNLSEKREWLLQLEKLTNILLSQDKKSNLSRCRMQPEFIVNNSVLYIQAMFRGNKVRIFNKARIVH
ncbi:gxcJJ [Acrasis kona]|uniref:GxcJJ n=1 Tax=Acrasis kona TaxID=1008807 RepID=A0AAW2ZJW0_9EUKA